MKTFETLYTVTVAVDKSKTIAMKAVRDLLRRVIVALECGRDVDVEYVASKRACSSPKVMYLLPETEVGSRYHFTRKSRSLRAICLSARVKHALLLMEWQLFSP